MVEAAPSVQYDNQAESRLKHEQPVWRSPIDEYEPILDHYLEVKEHYVQHRDIQYLAERTGKDERR